MNNKGSLISSLSGMMIFFFIIVAAVVGITTYQQGDEVGYKTYKAVSNMTWTTLHPSNESNSTIGNFVYDTVNLVGKYSFAFSKDAAKYGYEHPEVPWKLLVYGVVISILAPILYYGFLGIVVLVLLINEWRLNRKEKLRGKSK